MTSNLESWRLAAYNAAECLAGCLARPEVAKHLDQGAARTVLEELIQARVEMLATSKATVPAASEPVRWGAPKTVRHLIAQLQTLDPETEIVSLLRMTKDLGPGREVREVPLSISWERMNGPWLAPFKSEHRKVLAFWLHGEHKVVPAAAAQQLTVWYGSMPESNGKTNWTAILHRKGDGLMDGPHLTIARSEYPDRVRYEADQVRHIIGELAEEPDILAYDADAHSGYKAPLAAAHEDETVRKRIHQLKVLLDRCRDHVSQSMELMEDYDDAEEDAGIANELIADIDAAMRAQSDGGKP